MNSIMISLFSSVPKRQNRHGCRWFYQKRCFGCAETRSFHCTRMYNGKKCVVISRRKTHWDIIKFSDHLLPPYTATDGGGSMQKRCFGSVRNSLFPAYKDVRWKEYIPLYTSRIGKWLRITKKNFHFNYKHIKKPPPRQKF